MEGKLYFLQNTSMLLLLSLLGFFKLQIILNTGDCIVLSGLMSASRTQLT